MNVCVWGGGDQRVNSLFIQWWKRAGSDDKDDDDDDDAICPELS